MEAQSPRLQLRYKSLHDFTKLPLLSLESPKGVVGDSTRESIHSGVVNGYMRLMVSLMSIVLFVQIL
jgi:type III pantothenate kinase